MRTLTGHAGLIKVNMEERCGGAVEKRTKTLLVVNSVSILIRMMKIMIKWLGQGS